VVQISRISVTVVLLCGLVLAGCEQVMVQGPVGGSQVTVEELRTNAPLISVPSDTLAAAQGRWVDFDTFNDFTALAVLGIALLNALSVDEDSWYLVTAEGGEDYHSAPLGTPSQVQGTLHALMTGRQLAAGGFVVGPLSESAYQWVRPNLSVLNDAQLQVALDEYSQAVVADHRDTELDQVNYDDLLAYNTLYNGPYSNTNNLFLGSGPAVAQMQSALAGVSTDGAKRSIAVNVAGLDNPSILAEAVFEAEVSGPIAQGICGECHRVGSGNSASSTSHRLVPTSDSAHLAKNVQMYRSLVAKWGVDGILNRAAGQGHGGGQVLSPASDNYQNLENFLQLLLL
jgi:hypothetical protein